MHSFNQLAALGTSNFGQLFKASQEATLAEVIKVASLFSRFVDPDIVEDLSKPVSQGHQHHSEPGNEVGQKLRSFNQLAALGTSHFGQLFKASQEATLAEVMKVASLFPRFVDPDIAEDLSKPVLIGELEGILKWFKNGKTLGSMVGQWNFISIFMNYYDMIFFVLLKNVEPVAGCMMHLPRISLPLSLSSTHLRLSTISDLSLFALAFIRLLPKLLLIVSNLFYQAISP